MNHMTNKLKLSVSMVALVWGAGMAATQAQALTYDTDLTGIVVSSDVTGDLIVTSAGSITPDGLLVNANVSGNLTNAGLIEQTDSESATTEASVDVDVIALDFNGTVGGNVSNSGTINAEAVGAISYTTTADGFYENTVSASASGGDINVVTGNVSNSGTISAVASADLATTYGTIAAPVTSITVTDDLDAYAIGLEVDSITDGTISNSGTISAQATASADYGIIAEGSTVEVSLSRVSVYADATGLYQSGGGSYGITNSGTISATAASSVNVTAALDSTGEADAYLTPARVSAYAYGVIAQGVSTEFSNSGTITATASVKGVEDFNVAAQTSATISVSNRFVAEASTVFVRTLEGDFTNSGTITATASGELAVAAAATDADDYAYVSVDDFVYSLAQAVEVRTLNGSFSNGAEGTIAATQASKATYDLTATGPQATASLDSGSASGTATGVLLRGGEYDFTNSGSIAATASANLNASLSAEATDNYGYLWMQGDATNYAYGVLLRGTVTDFANSGSITAAASANAVEALSVTAGTEGTVSLSNSITASATGVNIDLLTGSFTNSGTISATASANLAVVASSTVADSTSAELYAYEELNAYAGAVRIGTLVAGEDEATPVFSNAADKSITATAGSIASYDLTVAGPSAYLLVSSISQEVSAYGLVINNGEYGIVNSGTISASANAQLTVNAKSSASDNWGEAYIDDVDQSVYATGIYSTGAATSFNNSGTISATAAASLTETVSAVGVTSASVTVSNDVYVGARGVTLGTLAADATNTGTISATASAAVSVTASASLGSDAGTISVANVVDVRARGFEAYFTTPAEDDPLHTFTNSGTITASAALSLNSTVPASTSVPPTLSTSAIVAATAAYLSGGLGSVTNSGTIAASVTAANADSATAVGLSLPNAEAGFTITNSGTIKADITGTADESVAIALLVGPLAEMDETMETLVASSQTGASTTGTSSGTTLMYASGGPAVITVTNTGTISATNEAGLAVGIGGLTASAPLVINQQGGSISGDIAIELDQGNADTLNWTGGAIHGIVSADELDVVNVFTGTGTPANKTVTADADFALVGGSSLNIGLDDTAVTFSFAGTVDGTADVNLNKNASLVMQTSGSISTGTFTMDPVSSLTFVFNPTDAGEILTSGDANIDGVLSAVALPGLYGNKGSHVVIASEGAVVGTFDNTSINGDTLLIDFTAAVHEQDVTISWKRNAFNAVPGLTINSTSVATALEEGYDPARTASKNTPELNSILSAMFTLKDAARYDRVLNSWSGSEHAQVMRAAANLSEPYHTAISEHLNDIRHSGGKDGQVVMLRPKGSSNSIAPLSAAGAGADESRFAFWGRAYGRWADTRGDVEATGYNEDTYGAVLGADFRVSSNVTLGLVTGYADDKLDFDDGDLGKIKRWTIGGYISATIDQFYVDGSLTYASDSYRVNRTIEYGNTTCLAFNCTTGASSKYDGDGLMGHLELGYLFDFGNGVALRPFAGLNYSTVDTDPFAESGGGDLGLEVLDGTGKSFQSRLGARLSGEWGSGSTKWVPELRAEWRHEFKDDPAWIVANLNGLPNDPFTAIGSKVTQDLAVVGAGVTALMSNGVGVFFDYQGAFGSGYNSHVIQGGVRVRF